ncbi:hypothetical protein IHN63_00185 [Deinococcus sp. 6YEL10]|uniref:hypothetical protein n=1 Tax=Deinococcus sp. 6YEL10 TaxID=2745870 RepID=UPI001E503F18|nr:hypothetical protein [Deinococcus sp. 6YEL10]MCD0159716.1 hypothetical protein [Deinococcus sp. 6YEL10]
MPKERKARYAAVLRTGTQYADRLPMLAKRLTQQRDRTQTVTVTEIATGRVLHASSVQSFIDEQLPEDIRAA